MKIILILIGILIISSGFFYTIRSKKKLSDENILEFEKTFKQSFIRYYFLSFLPTLLLCFFVLSHGDFMIGPSFITSLITLILINIFCYLRLSSIISRSPNWMKYKFAPNYFIFTCIGQLFFIGALASVYELF
jgi:hypothetical protein